jgi:hypothetical protein
VASNNPTPAPSATATPAGGIPGSSAPPHPRDAIPLPEHGFDTLDVPVRELATVPAPEVISRVAVVLVSAAAEKLGLAPGEEPDIDIEQARQLITALAGLLAASLDHLGAQREPLHDALRTLQKAFREAAARPDAPGHGPGEHLLS